MRTLYSLILFLALPFLFLRLLWRARHNPAYLKRWRERLGSVPMAPLKESIWIHAVSLGEVIAATPLIKALLQQYPTIPLVVTTTTPTGSAQVISQFKDKVVHSYLPFDLPPLISRFLNKVRPKLCIVMETELWPNLIQACRKNKVPLLLANARLSPKSARRYAYVAPLVRSMLGDFSMIAAQSPLDAERFLKLGLPFDKLCVTGNIKFDLQLPDDLKARGESLRASLGKTRPIWVVASTHEGEESIILDALKEAQEHIPELLLILVPRHPERFNKVAELCQAQGFKIARRSLTELPETNTAVFLGDSLGEMMLFYAASDVAFVGGSLVPIGGHNMLEPAALGLPILVGPHLHNFSYVSELLLAENALIIVNTAHEIASTVTQWIKNSVEAGARGQRALAVVKANRGAVAKHLELIAQLLKSDDSH